jgi:hypothetical protein
MAHTQTLIATLSLLISILIVLSLNESVYSNTDLNVPLNLAAYKGKPKMLRTNHFIVSDEADLSFEKAEENHVAAPAAGVPTDEMQEWSKPPPESIDVTGENQAASPVIELPASATPKPLKPPEDCRFSWGVVTKSNKYFLRSHFNENDDISREFLYGGFSARYAAVSAIVLSIGTFVLAVTVPELDLDMDAGKYVGNSWFHEGDTKKFVAGVFFRMMVAGLVLSLGMLGATSVGALFLQGFVPSAGVDYDDADDFSTRDLSECDGIADNVVYRSDALKASVFLSGVSVIAVGFLAYAVRYDRKASAKSMAS